MGKYNKVILTGYIDADKITILQWISNELAEANRLKIIELRFKFRLDDTIDGKDLKDKA